MATQSTPDKAFNPNTLKWDDDTRRESLNQVFEHTVASIENSIGWYQGAARGKKRAAQSIRTVSLLLLGIGTIIPVMIDLTTQFFGWTIPASLATLILAVGSGLLAFDRFMGYSTGWMRFLLTEMLLKAKLDAFRFQWMIENANRKGASPTDDEILSALNRFAAFQAEVSKIVQDETQLWVEEFQSNLRSLDENFQSIAQVAQSGAMSIKVDGIQPYEGGWDLYLDGNHMRSVEGETAALKDIVPGQRQIMVKAKDANGNVIQTVTEIVPVTPGSHVMKTFTLPTPRANQQSPATP